MKKVRGVSLLLCLALSLSTGCGAPKEDAGESSSTQSAGIALEDVLDIKETKPFSVGEMEGKTYINECFDIQCTAEKNWRVYGEEELVDMYNEAFASFSGDIKLTSLEESAVEHVLAKRNAEIPMMVAAGNTGSIMIYVLKEFKNPLEDYEGYMKDYMDVMETELSAAGRENVSVELSTAAFRGETVDCVDISYEQSGATLYQKTVLLFEGNYRASVMAVGYTSFDDAQRILDRFGTSTEPAAIVLPELEAAEAEKVPASFVVGSTEGGVYTNEALGLQCTLDDSWELASASTLQTEENMVFDDASINEAIQQGDNFFVMRAESPEGNISIKIMRADAVMKDGLPLDGREEAFSTSYERNVTEELTAVYEQAEVEECSVDFMGEEPFSGFDLTIAYQGENVYQRNLFILKDNLFGTVMIVSKNEESIQTITDCFTKYEP